MNSLHLLFHIFLLVALPRPQVVLGNAELRALMDLKSSLDPENKLLQSWTSDGDPCSGSFLGVACNEHNKVANISLPGRGLSGKLSPVVAELKCLSGLYLHYNHLSGEIPTEISNLNELVDLYLDFNNLSGSIPQDIGNLSSLQVLQLGYNQLEGEIPQQMGELKQLNALALQHNKLTGRIPLSLGNLDMLRRLNLSFNNFNGMIPETIAHIANLEVLDVQNNSLSGIVPSELNRLRDGFQGANNPGLCGVGFSTLKSCQYYVSQIDTSNVSINMNPPIEFPEAANTHMHCNHTHCSRSRRFHHIVIAASVVTITITFIAAFLFIFVVYRRRRQKIRNTSDPSEGQFSPNQPKEFYSSRSASPLVNLEYYHNGWGSLADGQNIIGFSHEYLNHFRFNVDEVESATQYFSEANLLGRSKFLAVYKGILRDGSVVAIRFRSISGTCCKTEEAEFVKGLSLLTSLKHENIVKIRGFCCSRSRGECFLIYDFATRGNLSQYLDKEDGSEHVLEWSKRVSIIRGIANGIGYLHRNIANKPTIIHQNISVEKVILDHQFNPLIMDAGLPKLLADDVVFSALKVSAAMGYLAPEYITTGRFTEKSDMYAFGVIVLQLLSGKTAIGGSIRKAVECLKYEDFLDANLKGVYSKSEAEILSKVAMLCTNELPEKRLTIEEVIQELSMFPAHSS